MERSLRQAYAALICWMAKIFGVPRGDGFSLLTMVGEMSLDYPFDWNGSGTSEARVRRGGWNRYQ